MGRFDDQREAQFRTCRNTVGFAGQHGMTRGWNTQTVPDLFGPQLVHGQRRSEDATAGVRDAQALQQALHAAVFTATAVEDDEGAVDLLALQAIEQVIAHIDGDHVDTGAGQRFDDCGPGLQRNFAFGTLAAVKHGNAAEVFRSNGRVQCGVCVISHFDFP
ncbi:hypothetical protein D9M71_590120 [compost metagenome]